MSIYDEYNKTNSPIPGKIDTSKNNFSDNSKVVFDLMYDNDPIEHELKKLRLKEMLINHTNDVLQDQNESNPRRLILNRIDATLESILELMTRK